MNNISIIKNCTSCGACVCSCPTKAITVGEDYYYKTTIDEEKCVSCGKCLSVCPINTQKAGNQPLKAVAGWSNQADVRAKSSSGGAFSVIADYVLEQNGVVFGARYFDDCKKIVFGSTDNCSLDELRRSKYVESFTGDSFVQVQNALKSGRLVLFCGTPCQVAGLSNYLGKQYDNLILCDFACGGLPSHKIYKDYIGQLEKKFNSKVVSVNFRPKVSGWSKYHILIQFANGKQYSKLALFDPFFWSFVYGRVSIRDNCYDCKFSDNHFSDISLADYWKYTDTTKIENDEKGISLVVANTEKGNKIIDVISGRMKCYDLDLHKASYNYRKTEHNVDVMNRRTDFFVVLEKEGLAKASKSCGMPYGVKAFWMKTKWKAISVKSAWRKK